MAEILPRTDAGAARSSSLPAAFEAERIERIERLQRLARFMDTAVRVPGTGVTFGGDFLLGLAPVVGDGLAAAAALYLVHEARQLGVPPELVRRMLVNVGLDFVVGSIPVAGSVFDLFFRANRKNMEIIEAHFERTGNLRLANAAHPDR